MLVPLQCHVQKLKAGEPGNHLGQLTLNLPCTLPHEPKKGHVHITTALGKWAGWCAGAHTCLFGTCYADTLSVMQTR